MAARGKGADDAEAAPLFTSLLQAREANQQFARILGEAANGGEIVITRRGQPVAVLAPYRRAPLTPEQERAIEEAGSDDEAWSRAWRREAVHA